MRVAVGKDFHGLLHDSAAGVELLEDQRWLFLQELDQQRVVGLAVAQIKILDGVQQLAEAPLEGTTCALVRIRDERLRQLEHRGRASRSELRRGQRGEAAQRHVGVSVSFADRNVSTRRMDVKSAQQLDRVGRAALRVQELDHGARSRGGERVLVRHVVHGQVV